MLPTWIAGHLNRGLDRMGDYHGQVAGVDVSIWRGVYTINALSIVRSNGLLSAPLVLTRRADVTIRWADVLTGTALAVIDVQEPEFTIIDSKSVEMTQYGDGVDWRKQVENLLPVKLGEVHIHNGRAHFRNFGSKPPIDLVATRLEVDVLNLSGVGGTSAASLALTARLLGNALFVADAHFDPLDSLRNFRLVARATGVQLRNANSALQAYAGLEIDSGTADVTMDLEAANGRLKGYAKPLFHEVKISAGKDDRESNLFRRVWASIVGKIAFSGHDDALLAKRVEFDGSIGPASAPTLDNILAILRRGVIRAATPG